MRSIAGLGMTLFAAALVLGSNACGDDGNQQHPHGDHQCDNGIDDDGDGMIDFPEDLGCISATDDTEDSLPMAQCSDGRDNDGDGITDYPLDPGCFAPQQDDEVDDCPSGPNCPQCSNGIDDDGNGIKDYPDDPGCTAASDTDEFTHDPTACGVSLPIKTLPGNNKDTGMFAANGTSQLTGMCGGGGGEVAYELRITDPKVIVATTDNAGTSVDTVLYIRGAACTMASSELTCNNDLNVSNTNSTVTASLTPGIYYLIVDSQDSSSSGTYDLSVQFFVGEGIPCASGDDCGPGLVCRVPLGDTVKKCSKHVCSDNVDDDGDGKNDFPMDPGCLDALDDDETDTCASGPGPGCPECGDGVDNDGDTLTDYPLDLQCQSASSTSEACHSTESVGTISAAMTPFATTGQTDDFSPVCGSTLSSGPDLAYRLDVPAMNSLTVNLTASYDTVHEILDTTCAGTALKCSDSTTMGPIANVAAGTYYVVVDGYSSSSTGTGTILVSGEIAGNASCEGALAQAGVFTCAPGYACKGAVGSRICGPALCNDGIDNDSDGKIDYPFDPGCDSPADDTEMDTCPGAGCPVCGDGADNDTPVDGLIDFPMDFGCASAAGTTEVFCMPETDPTSLITTAVTTGTTTGTANDLVPSCRSTSTAPDKTYALSLPVPVTTLVVDTIGSTYDTVLHMHDAACGVELGCDDDGGGSLRSKITLSNVGIGNYAITVDGYTTNNGPFTLNVKGTVATNTVCTSPLFAAGVL
ncbi:MAG: hypothetical protein NT062_02380, partial [Proteobacteria bacterium]|nr:hypothetical protein [Pseudomonadota bacterium]